MTRFKKYTLLMILLLCSYSYSWCQSNAHAACTLPTGEVSNDSVLLPIEAIKAANTKLIELKYEKEVNEQFRRLVETDSILIDALCSNLAACEINSKTRIAEVTKERNIAIGVGGGTSVLLLILLILAL